MKKVLFTTLWVLVAALTAAFLSGVVAFLRSSAGHDLSQDTWAALTAKFGAAILAAMAILLGVLGCLPGTKNKSTE